MVLNIFRIQIQLHHLVLCGGWLQDYIAAAYFIFSVFWQTGWEKGLARSEAFSEYL